MFVWAPRCQDREGKLFGTLRKTSKNTEIWASRTGGILRVCSSQWAEVHFWDLSRFLVLPKQLACKVKGSLKSENWKPSFSFPFYYFLPSILLLWGCLLMF